jgi:hypothetical protein
VVAIKRSAGICAHPAHASTKAVARVRAVVAATHAPRPERRCHGAIFYLLWLIWEAITVSPRLRSSILGQMCDRLSYPLGSKKEIDDSSAPPAEVGYLRAIAEEPARPGLRDRRNVLV